MDSSTLSFAGQSNKWNTAADAANVVEAIKNHKDLRILDLENNTLGPDAAKVIGDALAIHPEFERAHFKDLFTGRLKTEIPLALKHLFSGINRANAKLIELDLSDNALGPVGVEGMVEFMCSPACYTLQELRLNNNGLGITGGTMLAKSLDKLIVNSNRDGHPWKLKVFIAGRNRLEKVGAKIYADIFRKLGSLEELVMPQNGIFHEGIAALADALSHNTNLRVLNLNDNTFTKKGADAMALHLPAMQSLEIINFGDCLLKNGGAASIARALMDGHQNLRELCLDGNELTLPGALSVVEAIQNKPKFSKLFLDDNMFGDEGKEAIEVFLDDVGMLHALVPMENNCEPDSEDEEENEENEDESEESDEEDEGKEDEPEVVCEVTVVEAGEKKVEALDSSIIEGPVTPLKCTPAEYVNEPTAARLLGLEDTSALTAAATVSCRTPDQEITSLLSVLVRTAALAHTTDTQLSERVSEVVRTLGLQIFTRAKANQLISFTTNSLLVYLGLIKCEDKNFSVKWEQRGVLHSLASIVSEEYFPQDTKNTLQYFLNRPNSKLDALTQQKNALLTALSR